MKKSAFLILVFTLLGIGAMAQTDNTISIGLKGGVNMPRMGYLGNRYLNSLPQATQITPMGGLFVDIPIGNVFVVAPEFDYVERGTDITYEHVSGMQVHYNLAVKFVDFRLPLEFRIPIKPYLQPYATIGAGAGMRLGGKIHMDRTDPAPLDATIDVGDANFTKIYAGAFAGIGIRSLVSIGNFDMLFKLSATYHHGFLDTYTKVEREEAVPAVNVNAYNISGSRLPQGLEVCLSIGIPLKAPEDDACRTFSHDRYRRHGSGRHLFGF
jgi:hypothetical protein